MLHHAANNKKGGPLKGSTFHILPQVQDYKTNFELQPMEAVRHPRWGTHGINVTGEGGRG